jgi:drug/metabolite transporter (DMT)-like permease
VTASSTGPGVLLVTASAVAFSTAGLFTGLVQADAWTILFWRGLFGGLFIGGFVLQQHGRATLAAIRAMGRPGLVAGACSTAGTFCFIHALRLTSVAEVTVIFATAPFLAAALSWLWFRERQSPATLAASALALGGVLIMTGSAPASGHLAGNLLALAMTGLIAGMMVVMRRHRDHSMLPASSLSALACVILAWPFARPFDITGADLLWLALFGSMQFGLGLLLLTLGSRLLPGARTALFGNIELPLAPLWMWLAFGQQPSAAGRAGGGVVALALALDLLAGRATPRGYCSRGSPAHRCRRSA